MNAIERGKYDPSLPLTFKIAELFGLAIEDIFTPDWRVEETQEPPHK
ncbi:putative transcriptional regulator [Ardenticatena maritima]|uniref:Putative transcriptional regulator n=1 Tax=Ardenticatena maritima TaxID=872965 RepID=A0A0M9UDJ0_9CHLR|nr:hypothetical protein [Ardenticatena maritima]GAP64017.1 putative transcriptional regulator [Ardenticatena maritima]